MSIAVAVLNNGVYMPAVGLGTSGLSEDLETTIQSALTSGYRHLDTAAAYRNEADIGRALINFCVGTDADLPKVEGLNKFKVVPIGDFYDNFGHPHGKDTKDTMRKVFITGKVAPTQMKSEAAILASVNHHLQCLGRTQADLMLLHWPSVAGADEPPENNETYRLAAWQTLERLYCEGQLRAIGVSNFMEGHLQQLIDDVKRRKANGDKQATIPMVNQMEIHPLCQYNEGPLVDVCNEHKIFLAGYSPLGGQRGSKEVLSNLRLQKLSEAHSVSIAQVCLRYALQRGQIVLPKSRHGARQVENAKALEGPELSEDEMAIISAINTQTHFAWDPRNV